MPLVAELLRVLDPDAPRPEVASDADYARSLVDAAASAVIAGLQGDYSPSSMSIYYDYGEI